MFVVCCRLPVVSDCSPQAGRVSTNHPGSGMAVSRVPSPPPQESNTPVAENWCYTQVNIHPVLLIYPQISLLTIYLPWFPANHPLSNQPFRAYWWRYNPQRSTSSIAFFSSGPSKACRRYRLRVLLTAELRMCLGGKFNCNLYHITKYELLYYEEIVTAWHLALGLGSRFTDR